MRFPHHVKKIKGQEFPRGFHLYREHWFRMGERLRLPRAKWGLAALPTDDETHAAIREKVKGLVRSCPGLSGWCTNLYFMLGTGISGKKVTGEPGIAVLLCISRISKRLPVGKRLLSESHYFLARPLQKGQNPVNGSYCAQ